jgi:hypothetical protein
LNINNDVVYAPTDYYFRGGDYTFMLWFKFMSGLGSNNNIFKASLNTATNSEVSFSVLNDLSILNRFRDSISSTLLFCKSPVNTLKINEWQHLTFTFSSTSRRAKIYVNGVLVRQSTASGTPPNVVRNQAYFGLGSNSFDATYDEIKLFDVELSQAQIVFQMFNQYYQNGTSV